MGLDYKDVVYPSSLKQIDNGESYVRIWFGLSFRYEYC